MGVAGEPSEGSGLWLGFGDLRVISSTRDALTGYVRKHVEQLIDEVPIGSVTAEVLDSFYVRLRPCRDH
jgi:hypothetical protein